MTDNFETEELLFMIKKICLDFSSQVETKLRYKSITGIQVYLLVYIMRHHPEGTYLTELCHEIGVTKSTLSTLIKKLRENGYLYFEENPNDIRKKKVLPTEKLKSEGESFLKKAGKMESEICDVLSQQEKLQMRDLEQKLLTQLTKMGDSEENRQEVYVQ